MRTALIPTPTWSALNTALNLDRAFNSVFRDVAGEPDEGPAAGGVWNPAVDIREDENGVTVWADLPGVQPDKVQVTLEDNILTITGERQEEKKETHGKAYWVERFQGAYRRSIRLPGQISNDGIQAEYHNGVLEVHCPLRPEVRPRSIPVEMK